MAKKVETPLMKQYYEMKQKHPDAVLLFRVGDFYETYDTDAVVAAEILGITLTHRSNGAAAATEMAGFPHHALDTYLPKLVRAGKRVAICEQLEDPKLAKNKIVKRGITELVTPGVSLSDNCLDHRENNFLAAIHIMDRKLWGMALLDISTGEFLCAQGSPEYVDKLLGGFAPKELLLERGRRAEAESELSTKYLTFDLDDWIFTADSANSRLLKQFETGSLKGFGVDGMPAAIIAAGAILHYLDITQHTLLGHITSLRRIEEERYVRLDKFTIRNLELVAPMTPEGKSLRAVLDRTVTPMGARTLHRWLLFPLRDPAAINRRLDVVEHFFRDPDARDNIRRLIEQVGDLERLVSKVAVGRISPREVVQLRNALDAIEPVKALCSASAQPTLAGYGDQLNPCPVIRKRIAREIVDDAPISVQKGSVIRSGVSAELDELRQIAFQGKDYLLKIQQREIAATGIPSLKIAYNNVFGYYIEVTNTHRDKVPADWIRKQTLVNAERYITQELKEYEEKILTAQDRILILEQQLFNDVVSALTEYIPAIQLNARLIARLDCLLSFTLVAKDYKYTRPIVDDSLELSITEGRHPVIERQLPIGEPYITNSVTLSNDSQQIMMITGPNMSGKSALLRQTALNVIMAQMGCFVAAQSARIGVVDKVFTRVGASDNISLGESTFMVEMNEAASILNNLSQRSLILFDELGRGTSTYDGISIAWAIVEYLHQHGTLHPKTLFATHYHELNEMEQTFPRVVNYNVSVKEIDGRVVFLRKLARGGSEHSFGIHVAKLAGMPAAIVKRANEVLRQLEDNLRGDRKIADIQPAAPTQSQDGVQLTFFQLDDPVLTQIRDMILNIDIDRLTPLDALNKLHDIRSALTGK
ncbi:MAG: DNA mismatch repair protein MutS [Bacteroides sp.]|nr:DNA mismatch repair protein MutS [Bacteroides sp.]MCM1379071.1 DNA mismatch repair protein MutS [Bacteroides sp.]MCM1445769.1 DNA mismatch repair protein MutS [Prevotella sp.]